MTRATKAPRRQKLPLTYEPPTTDVVEETIREHVDHYGRVPSWGAIARALGVDDAALRPALCELLTCGRVVVERDGYNLACRLDTFESVIEQFTADVLASGQRLTPRELRERLQHATPPPIRAGARVN